MWTVYHNTVLFSNKSGWIERGFLSLQEQGLLYGTSGDLVAFTTPAGGRQLNCFSRCPASSLGMCHR